MSFHQRDEIRWNKKGYFERFDGKKYWRKLCVIEGCMKRAKVLNWCKRVSRKYQRKLKEMYRALLRRDYFRASH